MPKPASHYFSLPPDAPALDAPALDAPAALQNLRPISLRVAGASLSMMSAPGVFARSGLDAGSRLLIETALPQIVPDAKVCDLGCGWGPMGCIVARALPQTEVFMCDINPRAAQLAAQNASRNELANARAWCGDGLDAVRADYFNAILCNPPVRAGNAVIQKLFNDAQRCLLPEAVLWVVLRTAQGAKSWQKKLAAQFGGCETVAIDGGYRVFKIL